MAVPTTSSWTLDTDEVISAAFERLPGKIDQGYDIPKAIRAIQFTFQRLTARQVTNFKVTLGTLSLVTGDVDYDLPTDEHDVLEVTVRDTRETNPTDIPLTRYSSDEYHYLPDKLTPGMPTGFWIQRGRDKRTMFVWPAPNLDDFQIRYRRIILFRDVGTMTDHIDVPSTWLSVIVAGCTYFLALSKPEVPIADRQEFERLFEREIELIETEDRDKGPLRIMPDLSCYNSAW